MLSCFVLGSRVWGNNDKELLHWWIYFASASEFRARMRS